MTGRNREYYDDDRDQEPVGFEDSRERSPWGEATGHERSQKPKSKRSKARDQRSQDPRSQDQKSFDERFQDQRQGHPQQEPQRSGKGNQHLKSGDGPTKKKKGKKALVIILILLFLCLAGGTGVYLWLTRSDEIKPVTTYPTKDIALVTGPEALEDPLYKNIWSGIEGAKETNGMTTGYLAAKANTDKDFNTAIDQACSDYRIVVCYGPDLADNLLVKAQVYPQTKFIFIEGNLYENEGEESTLSNVIEVGFRVEEASYLAGCLAARAFNGCFGFIGGKTDKDTRAHYGFALGVISVDKGPTREILTGIPGSASDTSRIKDVVSTMFKNNAQLIYHSVNSKDEQTILETARSSSKKVILSGVVSGTQGDEVFAAVVKKYDRVMESLLSNYSQLKTGERVTYGYAEDALELTRPQKGVTDAQWKQIEDIKETIVKGQFTAPGTKDEYDVKAMQ